MIEKVPSSAPDLHRAFLRRTIETLSVDLRIVGVAAGGSYLTNTMDEFSDLDIIIAVEPEKYVSVMAERHQIANTLGALLVAFTGEHVGEPRLLICLYGPSLLHVDLKFVALPEVAERIEDPEVLWDRDGRLTTALQERTGEYPAPNLQWIEDRFWVWIHYGAGKIGRGELFEAIETLSFLRVQVLGPLGLQKFGARPAGVRKIELFAPDFADKLRLTLPAYDPRDCLRALKACADLYRSLRASAENIDLRTAAEIAAIQYLSEVEQRCEGVYRACCYSTRPHSG